MPQDRGWIQLSRTKFEPPVTDHVGAAALGCSVDSKSRQSCGESQIPGATITRSQETRGRVARGHTASHTNHSHNRYPLLVFCCSKAFCKYFRASSSAPWVLSLVCRACRYSLVARSRCP